MSDFRRPKVCGPFLTFTQPIASIETLIPCSSAKRIRELLEIMRQRNAAFKKDMEQLHEAARFLQLDSKAVQRDHREQDPSKNAIHIPQVDHERNPEIRAGAGDGSGQHAPVR
jgi:hypothetical protein